MHDLQKVLSLAAAIAVDTLDRLDGDPDIEANGDELDGCGPSEDEFYPHGDQRAGCPLSDPDACAGRDDIGTDVRASLKLGFDGAYAILDEDAEDGHDAEREEGV